MKVSSRWHAMSAGKVPKAMCCVAKALDDADHVGVGLANRAVQRLDHVSCEHVDVVGMNDDLDRASAESLGQGVGVHGVHDPGTGFGANGFRRLLFHVGFLLK